MFDPPFGLQLEIPINPIYPTLGLGQGDLSVGTLGDYRSANRHVRISTKPLFYYDICRHRMGFLVLFAIFCAFLTGRSIPYATVRRGQHCKDR